MAMTEAVVEPRPRTVVPEAGPPMLTVSDGHALVDLQRKGALDYVESLYNPGNFFRRVHVIVFRKEDLGVKLTNPTMRVNYLRYLRIGRFFGMGLSLPALVWQAASIIRRNKIKIIRTRNAYVAGVLGVLTAKAARVPVVISLGGDNRIAQKLLGYYYTGSRFISYSVEEFTLRNADRVFCVNEFTRRYAISLGVKPENTRVVPLRIDVEMFFGVDGAAVRRELGFGDEPVLLFVGRFERDKQVDVLVEAVPGILARHPKAKFVFIGGGRMRDMLEQRCRELGIMDSVLFPGFQPKEKIATYMAAATISWIPMSGFVIYEAAAAGKPIVAFDVEWHSEFVVDGVTGMLVRDRDVPHLVETVNALLDDPEKARALGRNANAKVKAEYDPRVVIEKEIEAYRGLFPSPE
jgi:glycosyltransferase involved in cell wall biosynthesis